LDRFRGELPTVTEPETSQMNRLQTAGLAGLLAILVAACSSQPSTTPATSTSPIPSSQAPVATPSPSVSEAPASTEPSSEASAGASLPDFLGGLHGAPDLEALLPDTLGGQPAIKMSFDGEQIQQLGSATGQTEFEDVFSQLDVDPADASIAIATSQAAGGSVVTAFRTPGVDEAKLLDAMKQAAAQGATEKVTWATETVGGKSVVTAAISEVESANPNTKVYMYLKDDTLYQIITADETIATEAISALP
jgi:hypothetical protein